MSEPTTTEEPVVSDSAEVPAQADTVKEIPVSEYTNLSAEELIKKLSHRDELIKNVNSEAKEKRLQIEKMQKDQTAAEQLKLEESNQFKEALEKYKIDTADYDELKTFKAGFIVRTEKEVVDLQSQLNNTEQEEYKLIEESLPIEKKLIYLQNKLKHRGNVLIDSTKGVGGGSSFEVPKNRDELMNKGVDFVKKFKLSNPTKYKEILSTP